MPVPGSAHTLQEHQCYDFNSVNSVEPDCGNMINNFTGIDCVSSDDTNTALFNSGTEIEKTSFFRVRNYTFIDNKITIYTKSIN